MRWFLSPLLGLAILTTGVAYAEAPPQGQRTLPAQNMNNAVQKLRSQHAPHLEAVLRERNLPASVVKAPGRILVHGVEYHLKPRLQLGLTGDPAVAQGVTTSIEARGTQNSTTPARVQITSTTGNIAGPQPLQHIQVTADNAPPATTPVARPYRDPRSGIQLTADNVVQWRNSGTSANPQTVQGHGAVRTFAPVPPNLKFRGEELPAGSHLVTTQSGPQVTMTFQPTGTFASIANPAKTKTYLIVPKGNGSFKRIKLTDQEINDLKAISGQRSYTVTKGAVDDNASPGYNQESLRSGGFIQ